MFAFTPESFKIRKSHSNVRKQAYNAEAERAIKQRAKQERKISRAFFLYLEEVTSDDVLNNVANMYKTGNLVGIVNLPTPYIQKFAKIATRVFISVAEEESKRLADILDIVQVDESGNPIKKVEISASIDITFNPGDPYAASLMKKAELDLIREISKAQREVIRKAMTDALNRGVGYVEASRMFKQNIGLTAYQQSAVDNFRRLLEQNDSAALSRVLRDRRFDPSISRAIRTNTPIGADKIGLMSDRYRERMVAMRAETIARTEGQRITNMARDTSTRQMLNKAGIQESEVERIWHSTPDLRTRDTHRAMNNQRRDLNDPFRSPSGAKLRFPGDPRAPAAEVINCRCVLETRMKEGVSQQESALPSLGRSSSVVNMESDINRMASLSYTPGPKSTVPLDFGGYKASPRFTRMVNEAFSEANDIARRAVNAAGETIVEEGVSSFYQAASRKISLRDYNSSSWSDSIKTVFRHEYGHYIDNAMEDIGSIQISGVRIDTDWSSARNLDAVVKTSNKYDKASASRAVIYSTDVNKWYTNKAMKRYTVSRKELGKPSDPNSLISRYQRAYVNRFEVDTGLKLDTLELSDFRKLEFVKAIELQDIYSLLRILRHDSLAVGTSILDFVGSVTRLRWGYGHSLQYYLTAPLYNVEGLASIPGFGSKIGVRNATEAFANWFSLYSMNPGTRSLMKLLAPDIHEAFEQILIRVGRLSNPRGLRKGECYA